MSSILLESGTGELEIIEFIVEGMHYAINVVKVKEVIVMESSNITKIPNAKDEIAGLMLYRDEVITLIDLKYVLTKQRIKEDKCKVIICEFNNLKVAFSIDDIVAVRRIAWSDIRKPDDLTDNGLTVGNILYNEKLLMMLDFEKIVTNISPSTGISEDRIAEIHYKDRSHIKIAIADDSGLIRRLVRDSLIKAGFTDIRIFNDGKEAYDFIKMLEAEKGENFIEDIHILITDIEMPQMDGLTLTRKIKEDSIIAKLPVIIFSSLVTSDLKHKAESVRADGQLSKPEIENLVDMVDNLIEKANIV